MADKVIVGNVEITAVLDMIPPPRHPEAFFEGVTMADWAPHKDLLENGQVQLYYGCFFLRSQGKVIMVDTGMGPGPHPDRGNRTGDLVNQLKQRGVGTDDVDIVVHTHLHFDHVGWNVNRSGPVPEPYFRRARYLVPRGDWEHFTKPENLDSAPAVREHVVPLQELGVMELVDSDHQITDEVTTLATPGHTPGHQVVLISSLGQKAMVVGDVLHSQVQVQEADWCANVDTDKAQSRRSRADLLDRSENEGYLIAAGHFHPDRHVGRVVRLEGKRYWQVA